MIEFDRDIVRKHKECDKKMAEAIDCKRYALTTGEDEVYRKAQDYGKKVLREKLILEESLFGFGKMG